MTRPRSTIQTAALALLFALLPSLAHAQDTDACIAASEQAVVLRKADKLVESRASLAKCAAATCPDAIRTSCQQRLVTTNQAVPTIVFVTKDPAGHDLATVKLSIDGVPSASKVDGTAIVGNPGEHEYRFEVDGKAPVVQRFVLRQGEQNRRETIVIGAPAEAVAPLLASPVAPRDSTSDDPHRGNGQRTSGLVIGGVGVASVVAGAVFGGLSLAAHNSYTSECGATPTRACVMNKAQPDEQDAATKGTVSTILFIAGGVAVAGGATLYLTAPKGVTASVGLGPGSFLLRGTF